MLYRVRVSSVRVWSGVLEFGVLGCCSLQDIPGLHKSNMPCEGPHASKIKVQLRGAKESTCDRLG